MAPARIDWWVRGTVALGLAHATLLATAHARPGLAGVVLWFLGPPIVALVSAALLAVAFVRTLKRRSTTRGHLAAYLLLGTIVASLALVRTYPSSYDARPSDVRVRLPLDGPVTVAWGGATIAVNYHVVMPDQRWAYDLLVTHEGRTHRGDGRRVEQYYAYGLPVLAPADGVVHTTRDGDPDEPPGYWRLRRVPGNHVVLRVAPDEYLFIAHLQPGSLRVAPGDRVRAGQVIGLVGNSGISTEPHVHLHLQDTPRPYLGEAIPFYFHDYRLGDVYVASGMPTGGQRNRRRVPRGEYTGEIIEHAGAAAPTRERETPPSATLRSWMDLAGHRGRMGGRRRRAPGAAGDGRFRVDDPLRASLDRLWRAHQTTAHRRTFRIARPACSPTHIMRHDTTAAMSMPRQNCAAFASR